MTAALGKTWAAGLYCRKCGKVTVEIPAGGGLVEFLEDRPCLECGGSGLRLDGRYLIVTRDDTLPTQDEQV